MKLHGVLVPVATPFDHRGELYLTKIHYNVSRWNRTRVSGYIVGGSTGEGRTLSLDERRKLWEEAAKEADSERLLLAGITSDGVKEAVRSIEVAQALGYKFAVAETPQAPRPWIDSQDAQALFFRALADQSELPLVVANPREPGLRLTADTVTSLVKHPNIHGVIEQSGNVDSVRQLIAAVPSGFAVLGGNDTLIYASLVAGAAAVAPPLANAAPFYCLSIEEAVRMRELPSAEELQQRADAAAQLVYESHGIAGLKYAMDLRGYYGGNPRLPFVPVGDEVKTRIAQALHEVTS